MHQPAEYDSFAFYNNWNTIVGSHGDREPVDVTHYTGHSLNVGRVLLSAELSPPTLREIQRTFGGNNDRPTTDETVTTFSLDDTGQVVVKEEKWHQDPPKPEDGASKRWRSDSSEPKVLEGRRRQLVIDRVQTALSALTDAERNLAINR